MSPSRLYILWVAIISLATGLPAMAAGQYKLAWWRQLGMYENAGCMGNHVMTIWVFDESGNGRSGVTLKSTSDPEHRVMGTTDGDGRVQITIDPGNTHYYMYCVDGSGATSDIAPDISSHQRACWGHYSFEVGFLYKSDSQNPGLFDTALNCTLNAGCEVSTGCPEDDDAPYSKSLAFNSINCVDYRSDQFELGTWQSTTSYFGQTFVANGNRVVAMRGNATIGGNNTLSFKAQIVTWPGLQPVGPPQIHTGVLSVWLGDHLGHERCARRSRSDVYA